MEWLNQSCFGNMISGDFVKIFSFLPRFVKFMFLSDGNCIILLKFLQIFFVHFSLFNWFDFVTEFMLLVLVNLIITVEFPSPMRYSVVSYLHFNKKSCELLIGDKFVLARNSFILTCINV